jgi:alkanesulfonate monooxygenase SsuD/methylene tetrahydromethanopterin reductase-like flavin-dependent oxidoreductase (luciferase family)
VVSALRRTERPYREQLAELRTLLDPSNTAAVPVTGGNVPELWLLGSPPATSALAAELGVPFAFARHLSPGLSCAADLVSVAVICAEDDERAEWLADPPPRGPSSRLRADLRDQWIVDARWCGGAVIFQLNWAPPRCCRRPRTRSSRPRCG